MELQNNKYYYLKDGKLIGTPDLSDIVPGNYFCFVTDIFYQFGMRDIQLIAKFVREEKREGSLKEKLEELCQEKKFV